MSRHTSSDHPAGTDHGPSGGPSHPKAGRLRRPVAVLLVVLLSAVPAAVTATLSPAAAVDQPAAQSASEWLAAQLEDGRYRNPLGGAATDDYGLMVDAVIAMYASGRGDLAEPILEILDDQEYAQDYFSLSFMLPRPDPNRIGGATAKTLVAALISGRDPRNFGGYDMVEELRSVITVDGPQRGAIADDGPDIGRRPGNTFAQTLAVIGFAGVGEVNQDVIDFLLLQQCTEGFFRIFPTYRAGAPLTCDEGYTSGEASAPDGDTTGFALSALLAAQRAGAPGLDERIDRTRQWLIDNQDPGGGWGGGVSTEAPNTNSTGLIVQALADAGGAEEAVARGEAYLLSAQATAADAGTAMGGDIGAMAYNPHEHTDALEYGIGSLDRWIRATAQASLGLSQTGFYDLVTGNVDQGPVTTTSSTSTSTSSSTSTSTSTSTSSSTTTTSTIPRTTTTAPAPPSAAPPPAATPPGPAPTPQSPPPASAVTDHSAGREAYVDRRSPDRSPVTDPQSPPEEPSVLEEATDGPAGELAAYLAGQLDGDHVVTEADGTRFVDHDATAEVILALRALGDQRSAAARATEHLLEEASIDAYVRGQPYEDDATYVEPLAKVLVLAELQQRDPDAPDPDEATVDELLDALAESVDGGLFVDEGEDADDPQSVTRHAWAILALTAHGQPVDDPVDTLLAAQCEDGGFPADLDDTSCAAGLPVETAVAVQALAAEPAPEPDQELATLRSGAATASLDDQRTEAIRLALESLDDAVAGDGLVHSDGSPDLEATSAMVGARAFLGEDTSAAQSTLADLQTDDGGFRHEATEHDGGEPSDLMASIAAVPALAGRDWTGTEESPVVAAVDTATLRASDGANPAGASADDAAQDGASSATTTSVGDPSSDESSGSGLHPLLLVVLLALALGGAVLAWKLLAERSTARSI